MIMNQLAKFQPMIQGHNIKKGTVVRRLDCAIEQVNRYPLNKDYLNLVILPNQWIAIFMRFYWLL